MSNNSKEFVFKIEELTNCVLCISADETNFDPNDFKEGSNKYKNIYRIIDSFFSPGIGILPYRMLIVCTSNSKSCTKEHFQHLVKDIITKITSTTDGTFVSDYKKGIHLIDKADATSSNNSSIISCARKKFNGRESYPFNCRTRIYGNQYLLSNEYQDSNGKIIKGQIYKRSRPEFIHEINRILKNIPYYYKKYPDMFEKNTKKSLKHIFVSKCEKRIINISSEGYGAILFDIVISKKDNSLNNRFIIVNSNLPTSSLNNISSNIMKEINDSIPPFVIVMINPANNPQTIFYNKLVNMSIKKQSNISTKSPSNQIGNNNL